MLGRLRALVMLPIKLLTYTIVDARHPAFRSLYIISLATSVAWIAVFVYLAVRARRMKRGRVKVSSNRSHPCHCAQLWWSAITAAKIGISHEAMGATLLAIGLSLPDLNAAAMITTQACVALHVRGLLPQRRV